MKIYGLGHRGWRLRASVWFAIPFVALAVCALASASASAATGRPFLRSFSIGTGKTPSGMAVDSAGNLYVLELGQGPGQGQAVEKFDSQGNPVDFSGSAGYISGNALTGTPTEPFKNEVPGFGADIAVDESGGPTDGYIYVVADRNNGGGLDVFAPSGEYRGFIAGFGGINCDVAVDQSNGDVYMTEISNGFATRFSPVDGEPSNDVNTGRLPTGSIVPCAIGIDSTTGAIYTSGLFFEGGSPFGGVRKYSTSDVGSESATGEAFDPNAAPHIATDPANHDALLGLDDRVVERAPSGALVSEFGFPAELSGVGATASETFVIDRSGTVAVFGPAAQLPKVVSQPAGGVTPVAAGVSGEVDPDGAGEVSLCEFRYGTDTSYSAGSLPCNPAGPIAGPTVVTQSLTGLIPGTTYHYSLVVENGNGAQTSRDRTFTTPPAVMGLTTGEATAVTKDSATLAGSYVGEGQDTHYFFEYGTTQAYGSSAPAPPGSDAGSGSGEQSFDPVTLTGLKGATTYHYRIVADNSFGTTYGEDKTFTTEEAITGLTTEPATAITNEAVDLNGSFIADSYDVHYYFEWGATASYGNVVPVPPGNDAGSGSGKVSVAPVRLSGLEEGGTYHYRIVASSENGTTAGPDVTSKTAQRPSVANLSTAGVQGGSAELLGEVNPNLGQTSYRFEWGPTAAYGNSVPVPDGDAGAGSGPVRVHAQLQGLIPGTTYHFRLVATNPYGTVASGDQTFGFYPPACPNAQVRQETGSNDLPDCRGYELTTPSDSQGATIFPVNGPNTGLATSPSRIAFGVSLGTLPETGDPMNSVADLSVATRTDSGWHTKYLGRPANEGLLMGGPPEGQTPSLFSFLSPASSQFWSAASPDMSKFINYDLGDPSGVYGQLGEPSNAPYVWDANSGENLGRWPTNLASIPGGKDFVGTPRVSKDFNHFVFSSNVAFASGGEEFESHIGCCEEHRVFEGMCCSAPVYDNTISTGQVSLISIKEDGTEFRGAPVHISNDGSRILMSETNDVPTGASRPLFLRVDDARTYDIAGGKSVRYAGSTADGKTVYFTSAEQLTPDDHDSSVDLFLWRESEPNSLTRVSAGDDGAGNSDDCTASWVSGCNVGLISLDRYFGIAGGTSGQNTGNGMTDSPIASANGDIYFESPEQLVGAKGVAGEVNLYLYRDGSLRYVTTMGTQVTCDEENGNTAVDPCGTEPVQRMQVTPSGSYMAFITASRLTSYDSNGKGEMYVYSPSAGTVICASCRPDGQPAQSTAYGSQNGLFITDDGRVFFSTKDALVPRDTDGVNDVYEYTEGRPQLISAGLGTSTEGFTGFNGGSTRLGLVSVSANGTDVYFSTYDVLVSQDHNGEQIKIYDARTGGGFPAERITPGCAAADECHGAGSVRPASPPDRTSAELAIPAKPKAHKKHKHRHKNHKHRHKKHRKQKKQRAKSAHKKQGGHDRG